MNMNANQIYMNMHKNALADMKEARARLPAVAVSKAERKAKVREYGSSHFSGHYAGTNEGLYFYAGIAYEQKRMSTIGFMSTFRIWCRALVYASMARNWYVGSILGAGSSIHSGIRASSGGGEQYKLGHFVVKCPLR